MVALGLYSSRVPKHDLSKTKQTQTKKFLSKLKTEKEVKLFAVWLHVAHYIFVVNEGTCI